ncbi:MAG: MBL fold metallo-hydrolase [Pyramidobacter sp.]|nr:MBL fold metallo-hydrolase [Pyramidobacter sp.]
MKFTVLVDNFVTSSKRGLMGEWGYSALVETDGGSMLIDTGASGRALLNNMKILGKDPRSVDHLVLSHGHDDHIGGVRLFCEAASGVKIWSSPQAFRDRFGDVREFTPENVSGGALLRGVKTTPVAGGAQILPDVYAFDVPPAGRDARFAMPPGLFERNDAGEIQADSFADDLSFLVRGARGWSILLGCAHASLPNVVMRIHELWGIDEFDTIIGGTHMKDLPKDDFDLWFDVMKTWRVKRWRLNHCTGFKAAARAASLFDDVAWAGVGTVLEL